MSKHKVCILCKHIQMDFGSPHYSDLTPGSEWKFSCDKSMWEDMSGSDTSESEYRKKLIYADDCQFYEEEVSAAAQGEVAKNNV
jgi:hypothetical protein